MSMAEDRQWKAHEVEMVEVVADQVAVALSHATVLEESQRTRDALVEQNCALHVARGRAEGAVRARNDFLAVMSHEMRTPLQAVTALASVLQESGLSKQQDSMVKVILRSSTLLSQFISDVLDFSRMEEGSLVLERTPLQLPALFQEAAKLAAPLARAKGLQLSLHIAADVPQWVLGDEKRLLQATLNILGHAVENTTEGSVELSVTLEPGNGQAAAPSWEQQVAAEQACTVLVEIRDTGRGFSDNEMQQLFQPFGGGQGGAGLGLAICRKFVQMMGGRIWVTSEGPGQGSCIAFTAALPTQPLHRPAEEEDPITEVFARELAGLSVMVVDDNIVNRMAAQALLQALGCQVSAVESALECLAELGQRQGLPFDALVLDVCMPEIDGFDVARRIHQVFRPDERPLIVALTARTDKGMREACLQAGMDAVLLKPTSLREIGATFVELIQQRTR